MSILYEIIFLNDNVKTTDFGTRSGMGVVTMNSFSYIDSCRQFNSQSSKDLVPNV